MNIKLSFLALTLAMLACMTTVEPYVTYPPDPTPTAAIVETDEPEEPESGAVFEITITARCATVTAAEALHLRSGPSEKTAVIKYLQSGEVVTLLDSRGAWWKVKAGSETGWAKAAYLTESECR